MKIIRWIKSLLGMWVLLYFVAITLSVLAGLFQKEATTREKAESVQAKPKPDLLYPLKNPSKNTKNKLENSVKQRITGLSQDPATLLLLEAINESGSWFAGDMKGVKHAQRNRIEIYEEAARRKPDALVARANK